jgi:hypothetical protein
VFTLLFLALPLLLVFGLVAVTLGFVASVLGFVVGLPFRILGLAFRLVGFVIALPFLIAAGAIGLVAFVLVALLGGGMLLIPVLPFVLLVLGAIWLVRRFGHGNAHVTH